ncbi:MAG TPA: hypothetical protein PLL75_06235 [Candidatus Omnitrophota bacterium]|nr:hypothetical protein [Candidatus Omnitrophota bacterium]HPS37308.1 hypothetical protein [Candidatus Omnitrophota bacterium]
MVYINEMQPVNQTPHVSGSFARFLPRTVNFLFYGSVFFMIATAELPSVSGPLFLLRKEFLAGHEKVFQFQTTGLPFAAIQPFLPGKGSVGFIMDRPYTPGDPSLEQFYAAQGYLAPLILNLRPSERYAFVYCSSNTIAEQRLRETNYRMLRTFGDGKGLAEKMP